MLNNNTRVHDKPAYRLYDKNGGEITYRKMLEQLSDFSVVLFGELHNNPVVHWLQLEVTKDLFSIRRRALVLGAEMFEADDQIILDEYLSGTIGEDHLKKEAKIWDNYETDYRPLVEFAKAHRLRFIATNVPRRYASLAARKGLKALTGLPDESKRWIVPLPIRVDLKSPTYRDLLDLSAAHGIKAKNFLAAQAIKDATMSHFILKNLTPGGLFIHFHGEYHTRKYGGICWYLRKASKDLRAATITAVEAKTLEFIDDYSGLADYTLVIPHTMTKTC
ncbi:MAG: ChaN family lipoprotein [Nitrospirota bacterium]|nr:ChaN family lipoprotein [Nitrospirota bacterium]